MKKLDNKIIHCISFFIFFIVSVFSFSYFSDPRPTLIKKGCLITENKYFKFLENNLDKTNKIYVFLPEACMSCEMGYIINQLDSLQIKHNNIKCFVFLPSEYSENDIYNLNNNYNFKVTFKNISKSSQKMIDNKNAKYLFTDYYSVAVNKNGIITFSDYLRHPYIPLTDNFDKLIHFVSINEE